MYKIYYSRKVFALFNDQPSNLIHECIVESTEAHVCLARLKGTKCSAKMPVSSYLHKCYMPIFVLNWDSVYCFHTQE